MESWFWVGIHRYWGGKPMTNKKFQRRDRGDITVEGLIGS